MELEREPNPQSAPEATGSVSQEKKQRIITAVAVGVAILLAMLLGWMWTVIRRPAQQQSPTHTASAAAANSAEKAKRDVDEAAEKAYEKGRRDGARSNPAFNPNGAGQASGTSTSTAEHKRTPRDDYDDLLAKAALADSTVAGENGASRVADTLKDFSRDVPNQPIVPQPPEEHKADAKPQPVGANTIPAGTFIDCSLVNALNGDNVGPVKVQVSNDVYYPLTFDVAIPQGSIFLGEAQKVSTQFQQRLAVAFDRLQLRRDGKLYDVKLDRIPGLDQQGATALKDKVNNHYLQIFGASLAIGAIGGLAQIGSGSYGGYNGIDTSTQIRNGISQSMAENASQILNRFLTRLPSVSIRPGNPVIVYIPFGVDIS